MSDVKLTVHGREVGRWEPLTEPPDTAAVRAFACELRAAYQRGADDFQTGASWHATALQYEDEDLARAYIGGWTDAEQLA